MKLNKINIKTIVSIFLIFVTISCQNSEYSYKGKRIKINISDYSKFIIAHKTNKEFVKRMFKEYGELEGDQECTIYEFGIDSIPNWLIIKIPTSLDFYTYHNISGWLLGYDDNPGNSDFILGIAFHKFDRSQNYYFFQDMENEYLDTQIGIFENGKSFFIYQPEAYEKNGNIRITNDFKIEKKEIIEFLAQNEFTVEIEQIKKINFEKFEIKIYK